MTAFGRSDHSSELYGNSVCEIRSVNHRYLDLSVKLAEPFKSLEPLVRERLTATLRRGKVEVHLSLGKSQTLPSVLSVNETLLKQLVDTAKGINQQLNQETSLDVVRMMQWPGVLRESADVAPELLDRALDTFDAALADFVAMREREGSAIKALLLAKSQNITEHVIMLRRLRPKVVARQREKWLVKLDQLQADPDPGRLEQELIYVAQRLDVDEELDRLDAHISELLKTLERLEPIGRRLDFLMQELNREANTLSSKSADVDTTNSAVDIKVLIEQMREQVQNIE